MASGEGFSTFNGDADVGFSREWFNSDAATDYVYAEKILGIPKW